MTIDEVPNTETTTPKRRPGRPKKTHLDDEPTPQDPGFAGDKQAQAKPKRKNKASDIESVAKKIQGLHYIIAQFPGLECMALGDIESAMLAAATCDMIDEYGWLFTGKTGALLNLAAACGLVYVPRLIAISKQRAKTTSSETPGVFTMAGDPLDTVA